MLRKTEDLCQNRCVCGGANISCDFNWYVVVHHHDMQTQKTVTSDEYLKILFFGLEHFQSFEMEVLHPFRGGPHLDTVIWVDLQVTHIFSWLIFLHYAKGHHPSQGHICRLQLCTKESRDATVFYMALFSDCWCSQYYSFTRFRMLLMNLGLSESLWMFSISFNLTEMLIQCLRLQWSHLVAPVNAWKISIAAMPMDFAALTLVPGVELPCPLSVLHVTFSCVQHRKF